MVPGPPFMSIGADGDEPRNSLNAELVHQWEFHPGRSGACPLAMNGSATMIYGIAAFGQLLRNARAASSA